MQSGREAGSEIRALRLLRGGPRYAQLVSVSKAKGSYLVTLEYIPHRERTFRARKWTELRTYILSGLSWGRLLLHLRLTVRSQLLQLLECQSRRGSLGRVLVAEMAQPAKQRRREEAAFGSTLGQLGPA